MRVEKDFHHFHWTAREHKKTKLNNLIRNHQLSGAIMIREIHEDLHNHIEPVRPQQTRKMSEHVLRMLNVMKGSYTPLDAAKMLSEAGIPELSEHLGRQIPFIELSIEAMKKRHI